jgi:hypothetical protein
MSEPADLMPLYGFLEGDTLGLVVLARRDETAADLVERLQAAAAVRVRYRSGMHLLVRDRIARPDATLSEVGLTPLDRFDVVRREGA